MATKKNEILYRFVGHDGEFQPSENHTDGLISFKYLNELMEWVFYHNNYNNDEKLEHILNIEDIVRDILKKRTNKIKYIPNWSIKLKKKSKK